MPREKKGYSIPYIKHPSRERNQDAVLKRWQEQGDIHPETQKSEYNWKCGVCTLPTGHKTFQCSEQKRHDFVTALIESRRLWKITQEAAASETRAASASTAPLQATAAATTTTTTTTTTTAVSTSEEETKLPDDVFDIDAEHAANADARDRRERARDKDSRFVTNDDSGNDDDDDESEESSDEAGEGTSEDNNSRRSIATCWPGATMYTEYLAGTLPRTSNLTVTKEQLIESGWHTCEGSFPDPMMPIKIKKFDTVAFEPEWFMLLGAFWLIWDPLLFFGRWINLLAFYCPVCKQTSTKECPISREGVLRGFKPGWLASGKFTLIKTTGYKHSGCSVAKDKGKKSSYFSSISPGFMEQLPPNVRARFPFVISPNHVFLSVSMVEQVRTSTFLFCTYTYKYSYTY
jgi:hypothetical protein